MAKEIKNEAFKINFKSLFQSYDTLKLIYK